MNKMNKFLIGAAACALIPTSALAQPVTKSDRRLVPVEDSIVAS